MSTIDLGLSKEYTRGYDTAKEAIEDGCDATELYRMSTNSSSTYDNFDKGWRKACVDNGAETN